MEQDYAADFEARDISDEVASDEAHAAAALTSTWRNGRLVKVSPDADCGFIRASDGALVYFSLTDVAPAVRGLRPSALVRYQARGASLRATAVAAI